MDSEERQGNNSLEITITGAGGFIGRNLVKYLSSKNHKITGIVRENPPFELDKNVKWLSCDLRENNKEELSGDVLIHLAATRQHFKGKQYIVENNIETTKNVLKFSSHFKHFIFASSTLAKNPIDPYSESKKECEEMIKESEINYTILRIGPVFGKGDKTNLTKIIQMINNGKRITLPGGGNQKIQPTFIEDVLFAINSIILNEKFFKKILVIAGKAIKLNEFVEVSSKILKKNVKKIGIPIGILKPIVKIYQNISKNPEVTIEQLENLEKMSDEVFNSDFKITSLEESIKKSIEGEE